MIRHHEVVGTSYHEDFFFFGSEDIVDRVCLREEDVLDRKLAGVGAVGSDAWIDVIMNPTRELEAIARFYELHKNSQDWSFESKREEDFQRLLRKWIFKQHGFALAEHGSGRYLDIQPSYMAKISKDDTGLKVLVDGLDEFGDHSGGYVRADKEVGDGLLYIYDRLKNAELGTWVVIVSPTEKYKKYGSDTDVINIMRVVEKMGEGEVLVECKYVIPNKELGVINRRRLHNLLYERGTGRGWDAIYLPDIVGDTLLTQRGFSAEVSEVDQLVRSPNFLCADETEMVDFVEHLTDSYYAMTGERLVKKEDIAMYKQIGVIVDRHIDALMKTLYFSVNGEAYKDALRRMLMQSQAIWAQVNPDEARKVVSKYKSSLRELSGLSVSELSSQYLSIWLQYELTTGFEAGLGELVLSGGYNYPVGEYASRWGGVYGEEVMYSRYCKKHGWYKGSCSKCSDFKDKRVKKIKKLNT